VRRLNLFARAALRMAVAKPDRLTSDVRAGFLAPYDCWAHRVAIERFVRDIPDSPRHPTWQTLEALEQSLPSLAPRPCQLIWGMRDWCFRPVCLERLCQSFPRAETHRFADASHYVVEDAYERIIPLMEPFLATAATTTPDSPRVHDGVEQGDHG
jgi:haloalkane dehalogenase